MTPRSEALAFRIWQYCEPREWINITVPEIAEELDECPKRIGSVMKLKGWHQRLNGSAKGRAYTRLESSRTRLYLNQFDDWREL
jgi:hypothetical protein